MGAAVNLFWILDLGFWIEELIPGAVWGRCFGCFDWGLGGFGRFGPSQSHLAPYDRQSLIFTLKPKINAL
jgi:hypothetical protein